jgi:hypothetical protein
VAREYTWAGDTLENIGIEPREGGHCVEVRDRYAATLR